MMTTMKTLALSSLYVLNARDGHAYTQEQTLPEEIFILPEAAVYLMLAMRLVLLIVGRPWHCKPGTVIENSCSWVGGKRVCACT
jgi:hypothetical protein